MARTTRTTTSGPRIRDRGRVKLKGLKRYSSNGIDYIYHRASGVKLPTDIPEDHPRFLAAYLDAENGPAKPTAVEKILPNSVADVCRLFMASRKFRELSEDYQSTLRRDMNRLCEESNRAIAELPFRIIKRNHIELQMDKLERNPGNQRLKTWRYLTDFAVKRGLVSERATEGVKANPELNSGGHKPWTLADIEQFRGHWSYGTKQRLGLELQFWAGARISDTRKLGPENVDREGWLNFVQEKTGSAVSVPMKRALPNFAEPADLEHLHKAIEAMPKQETVWLLSEYGKIRSKKGASQWFAEQARKAGLIGLTSHGLRKSRMILHAENGASSKEIAAWSGHETLKEIERYVRDADRRKLLTPSVLETGKFL